MYGASIDIQTIQSELSGDEALLVDVRTEMEFNMGHAKDALNFDLEHIMNGDAPTSDTTTKLYLYCNSGSRSGVAAQILSSKGFDVVNIGGLAQWHAAGGPVE